ncbi:MAG: 3-hydroxybutyryl-CoA dehydrogenase [Acidimicrobiales bacterium]|nr:3-hydroxybutyryl-CoA dehydrogenase [Acidimicrobiales bacterium]
MIVEITRVGVIGAGTMGSGIAEVCARAGLDTRVVEMSPEFVEKGRERVIGSMDKAAARGRMTQEERDIAVDLLSFGSDLGALDDRDLVIEAIVESEDDKVTVFQTLDKVMPAHGIIASNTSSIPIIRLATVTQRTSQVVGLHFFNPAPVQPLVEIVRCLRTSDETVEAVQSLAETTLGKHVIHCRDRAGFIVNRLLVPYLLAAIRMLDSGEASREDIDNGMRFGCAHPMGPLELCDLVGLDTVKAVADVMFEEFKEPLYAPPPLLNRMVSAGKLGRKTGEGFYDYA